MNERLDIFILNGTERNKDTYPSS